MRFFRAEQADVRLCLLSLPSLFPAHSRGSDHLEPYIDPLTLSLINNNTLILLNKTDAFFPLSSSHHKSLNAYLESRSINWLNQGERVGHQFWPVSVKTGEGMKGLIMGLKAVLQEK